MIMGYLTLDKLSKELDRSGESLLTNTSSTKHLQDMEKVFEKWDTNTETLRTKEARTMMLWGSFTKYDHVENKEINWEMKKLVNDILNVRKEKMIELTAQGLRQDILLPNDYKE